MRSSDRPFALVGVEELDELLKETFDVHLRVHALMDRVTPRSEKGCDIQQRRFVKELRSKKGAVRPLKRPRAR